MLLGAFVARIPKRTPGKPNRKWRIVLVKMKMTEKSTVKINECALAVARSTHADRRELISRGCSEYYLYQAASNGVTESRIHGRKETQSAIQGLRSGT